MNLVAANESWLDGVPADWSASRVRNVAELSPGYSDGAPTPDELCTVVPMELLSEAGTIETSSLQAFEDITGGLTLFEAGDVLLNITGASIGRCTFVPEDFGEGNVNQHVCIIRGNHKIDHRFLAAFLSSPMGQGQVLSSFTGASRQGLSHKELGLISIPLPSIGVQRNVVVDLEQLKSQQKQVRDNIESQIETLTAYRKSLIYECVTGQRRVTEADVQSVHHY